MAKLVFGMGMSHSPMMATQGERWDQFAEADYTHPMLWDQAGNHVTYAQLEKQVNRRYAHEARPEVFMEKYRQMRAAFDRLHKNFHSFEPDVVIVIANDHDGELFGRWNVPALAVFYGERVISAKLKGHSSIKFKPEVIKEMSVGMGMDDHHVWPGSPEVGLHLIKSLIRQHFDVGALQEVDDPSQAGHGHGFGMVVTELMRDKLVPMVPVYLNTWEPNVFTLARCYDLGVAIRKAVEEMPQDIKVGFIASGGLSHFVTDQELDQQVIEALQKRDVEALLNLPEHRLKAGSSEIRNWIVLAGVVDQLALDWIDYVPVYRTAAGTGLGMGFACWS